MKNDTIIADNILDGGDVSDNNSLVSTTELSEEDYKAVSTTSYSPLDYEYVLDKMEQLRLDNAHIEQAFNALKHFQVNESPQGGISDAERAKSIMTLVRCRETTLQRQLEIVEKLYGDLRAVGTAYPAYFTAAYIVGRMISSDSTADTFKRRLRCSPDSLSTKVRREPSAIWSARRHLTRL